MRNTIHSLPVVLLTGCGLDLQAQLLVEQRHFLDVFADVTEFGLHPRCVRFLWGDQSAGS